MRLLRIIAPQSSIAQGWRATSRVQKVQTNRIFGMTVMMKTSWKVTGKEGRRINIFCCWNDCVLNPPTEVGSGSCSAGMLTTEKVPYRAVRTWFHDRNSSTPARWTWHAQSKSPTAFLFIYSFIFYRYAIFSWERYRPMHKPTHLSGWMSFSQFLNVKLYRRNATSNVVYTQWEYFPLHFQLSKITLVRKILTQQRVTSSATTLQTMTSLMTTVRHCVDSVGDTYGYASPSASLKYIAHRDCDNTNPLIAKKPMGSIWQLSGHFMHLSLFNGCNVIRVMLHNMHTSRDIFLYGPSQRETTLHRLSLTGHIQKWSLTLEISYCRVNITDAEGVAPI